MDADHVLFQYAGGWADIRNRKPMTAGTTMMAYSMTKTLTAAAILQLAERGKVNLGDSIDLYLDHNPYGSDITISHLLSQTSGIPNPIPLGWMHTTENHDTFDEDAALEEVLRTYGKPSFAAGKKYAYSNISYWFLGRIIEKAGGRSYADYMRKHVFDPLGVPEKELGYAITAGGDHAKGYTFFLAPPRGTSSTSSRETMPAGPWR